MSVLLWSVDPLLPHSAASWCFHNSIKNYLEYSNDSWTQLIAVKLSLGRQRERGRSLTLPFCWTLVPYGTSPTVSKKLMAKARAPWRSLESQSNICTTRLIWLMCWRYSAFVLLERSVHSVTFFPMNASKSNHFSRWQTFLSAKLFYNGSPYILSYLHFLSLSREYLLFRSTCCYPT